MVRPQTDDPALRWSAILQFYAEAATTPGRAFLSPMISLAEWIATQPWARELYPFTSHDALCVSLSADDDGVQPFAAFEIQLDGQLACELWSGLNRRHRMYRYPMADARRAIANTVQSLMVVAAK